MTTANGATALALTLELAGCDTPCQHCWAQGGRYPAMPLADVEWVLAQARGFCRHRGVTLTAFPMHEVAAHPQAAEVLRLFRGLTQFEPLATTGGRWPRGPIDARCSPPPPKWASSRSWWLSTG